MKFRFFDAGSARFVSVDPVDERFGSLQGQYNYGDGDPANRIDPDGQFASCVRWSSTGNAGTTSIQQSPGKSVQWGVRTFLPSDSAGWWNFKIYKNGKKTPWGVNKFKWTAPHGSIPPGKPMSFHPGDLFHFDGWVRPNGSLGNLITGAGSCNIGPWPKK